MSPNVGPGKRPNGIVLERVSKHFPGLPRPAVAAVSATLAPGRITGLAGPDGAGKTTLLRILAGLLETSEGSVRVAGLDPIADTSRLHACLGYMPQKFGLYDDLSVQENLDLYADLRGVTGQERQATFKRLLQFTDLTRFTSRHAGKLSGGMKQKLGLACALLGKPKVLLLDEPSVGVDPISRRELWRMVNELADEGMTIVWSTSYLDEAEHCADVLLMHEGRLLYAGPPQDLTHGLQGRALQVRDIEGNRREVLRRALRQPEVIDGVIQGRSVRLVLREAGTMPVLEKLDAGPSAHLVEVKPRFEDAYIDQLARRLGPGKKISDGNSALAEAMRTAQNEGGVRKTVATRSGSVIQASALTKKFGDFVAADAITFTVERGEIYGLLGPNGAGKSTTFKMLCGLLRPTSGEATVAGLSLVRSASSARQHLGYMAQKFSLYSNLSVRQNLQFFSGTYGLKGSRQSLTIRRMVDTFELGPFLDASPDTLALGYKQRLALACAVMHEPDILFLDEPTSGVDPVTRREFWTHINGAVSLGVTVLVTTHFMDEAEYCDRIGLIYHGRLIATGTPDELKEQAASDTQPDPSMEDAFIALVQRADRAAENAHA
jgi:ABC-2 type transport system ATP-binding protein